MTKKLKFIEKKENTILNIMKVIFFALLVSGIFKFAVGMHNIDNCQNLMRLELDFQNTVLEKYGENYEYRLIETDINGGMMELKDGYRLGLKQAIVGFIITLIGSFFFGALFFKEK